MSYKKLIFIISILLMFIYPDEIFLGLATVLILLIILLLVIELALDIYIIVIYLIQYYKEKN